MTIPELAESYDNKVVFRRWWATLIDFFVLWMTLGIIGLAFPVTDFPFEMSLLFGVPMMYYFVFEFFAGWTIGKRVSGIVVVAEDGRRPSAAQTAIRTLLRLIEVNPILIGAFPAILAVNFSKRKQRLGDMAAGTYVIFRRDLLLLTGGSTTTGAP